MKENISKNLFDKNEKYLLTAVPSNGIWYLNCSSIQNFKTMLTILILSSSLLRERHNYLNMHLKSWQCFL